MNTREFQRNYRIDVIRRTIQKARAEGREIVHEKLIREILLRFGVTRRTANEYLEIAGYYNIDDGEPEICEGEEEGVQDSAEPERCGI